MVGVTYRKDRDRWAVQFRKHKTGEFIFVGYHVTKEGAMMMYDQYILDNNMAGYKLNYQHHKKKPYIRKRSDILSNYDENQINVPAALE